MPDVLDTLRLVWLLGFVAIIARVICRLRLYQREEGERFMLEGGLKGDVVLNSDHVIDRGTTQNGFKYYLQNLIHRSLYEMAEIIDSLDMTSVFLTLFVIGALCTTNRMTAYVLWDEEEEPLARMEREAVLLNVRRRYELFVLIDISPCDHNTIGKIGLDHTDRVFIDSKRLHGSNTLD
eukprot:189610_1